MFANTRWTMWRREKERGKAVTFGVAQCEEKYCKKKMNFAPETFASPWNEQDLGTFDEMPHAVNLLATVAILLKRFELHLCHIEHA
jgi:hypothetical protein